MQKRNREGLFEVIDSFAIRRRSEFYLIGQLKEGNVEKNWFINVGLNQSLSVTVRISDVEKIEITNDNTEYKLIIISCDTETLDFLLGLKIGSELMEITIDGQD